MSQVKELLATLQPHQQQAITLLKISLDCFNGMDGTGLFKGVERYNVLSQRASLSAVQARDMHGFWACLLRKMQWPLPPKRMDSAVVEALLVEDAPKTLRCLATETVSLITLARMLHDEDKAKRKEFYKELYAEQQEENSAPFFDDSLEGI